MGTALEGTVSHAEIAAAEWREACHLLSSLEGPNGEKLNLDQPVPGTGRQVTLNELDRKLSAVLGLAKSLRQVTSDELLPDGLIGELASAFGDIHTKVSSVLGAAKSAASSPIAGLDVANYNITNTNSTQANISGTLIGLRDATQVALLHTQTALSFTRIPAIGDFASNTEEIANLRSQLRRALSDLSRIRKAYEAAQGRVAPVEESVRDANERMSELLSAAQDSNSSLTNIANTGNELLAKIQTANTKAVTLEETVSNYNEKFQKFDTDLSERNTAFTTGKQQLDELIERLKTATAEAERLQARSRDVLGEATVAGLSERFANEKSSIDTQMKWAQGLFFLGVALFILSAGASLGAFPWLEENGYFSMPKYHVPDNPTMSQVVIFVTGNLFGKVTLLLPSLLLVGFSIKWYAEQFRLRAQYAYKYTVAASLPGFKAEAEQYADAMTASAFKELLFNPAEKNGDNSKSDEKQSWLDKLIEPLIAKKFEEMMKKLGK